MNSDVNLFGIEDGLNTSYIETLFIALFYTPSSIYYNMLDIIPKNINFIYFQEMIKINFIEPLRKNISIQNNIINEIRNFCFLNGWLMETPQKILMDQDITKYLNFIVKNIDDDFTKTIELKITNDIDTKILLEKWNEENIMKIEHNILMAPIYLNRVDNKNHSVDIKKKIKIKENIKLEIHSIICHNTKYYCIFINNNKWYIFENCKIPCIRKIDIKEMADKIKSEAILLIYKMN